MTKGSKIFFTIISLLLLASVFFLPVFDEGGGILTSKAKYNFARVIGDCLMKEGTLSLWVTHMTLGIFIPSVTMLACALTRLRVVYVLSNIAGIAVWFVNVFRLGLKNGFLALFDVHSTDVSIGSWIALLLFLISALGIIATKKKQREPEEEIYEITDGRCPQCGIRLRGNLNHCPRCNIKLKTK